MNTRRWLAAIPVLSLVPSCRVFSQPVKSSSSSPTSNLLVSGELARSRGPYDFKGEVTLPEDAHGAATLAYVSGIVDITGGAGRVVSNEEHKCILEAVRAQDVRGAKGAMHRHLERAMKELG